MASEISKNYLQNRSSRKAIKFNPLAYNSRILQIPLTPIFTNYVFNVSFFSLNQYNRFRSRFSKEERSFFNHFYRNLI